MANLQKPAIRGAGRHTPKNYWRFYPGRKPRRSPEGKVDDRILFESAIYARLQDSTQNVAAGIVVGPTLDRILAGGMEKLQDGAGLVAARAVEDEATGEISIPPVRTWPVPGGSTLRTFMDLLTLRRMPGGSLNAVPLEEEGVVYVECCTGDPQETEESYIAALSGLWVHGSAEYMGFGNAPLISSPGKRRGKPRAGAEDKASGVKFSETSAPQLWGESVGSMVNGVPLWWNRVWRLEFTKDETQAIIVRQQNKYYMLYVEDGRVMVEDRSNQPGIAQVYLDNVAKLASLGVSTTPLIVPSSGIVQTTAAAA